MVCYLLLLEILAPKMNNYSKYTKELDIFANWTVDCARCHAFHEN